METLPSFPNPTTTTTLSVSPQYLPTFTKINPSLPPGALPLLPLPCLTLTDPSLVPRSFTYNHQPILLTAVPSPKSIPLPTQPYTLHLSTILPRKRTTHHPQIIPFPPSTLTLQLALPLNKRSPSPKSAFNCTNMISNLVHESHNPQEMSQLNTVTQTTQYGQVIKSERSKRPWSRARSTAHIALSDT